MAIAASGAVSFSDLRTEFVGGSAAISYSDLYRGGPNIRAKAADNTAANLAASVPTSGTINIANFRGTAKGFRKTYTSDATNQNASTIFGDDYAVNYSKEIVINSGVELGATSSSEEALEIPAGGAGTITITNNGTISGAGGTAGGGTGGDAFEAGVACTLINNGTIRAGGGGGGAGGTGGGGSYQSTSYSYVANNTYWSYNCGWTTIYIGGSWSGTSFASYWWQTSYGNYRRGTLQYGTLQECGALSRFQLGIVSTTNTNGGAGGAGGKGQGYVSANANGSGGSAGGSNAGTGGTGGTGGTYGNSGGTGATGANGNRTNGVGGSGGGAPGKYIRGISFVTYTNNGSNLGGTA